MSSLHRFVVTRASESMVSVEVTLTTSGTTDTFVVPENLNDPSEIDRALASMVTQLKARIKPRKIQVINKLN